MFFYKIFKIKVNIIGCSRTDAGVHAKEFYFNIHLDNFRVSCVNIKNALNTYLPYDIRILDVFYVDEKFHSRYDALKKNMNIRYLTEMLWILLNINIICILDMN